MNAPQNTLQKIEQEIAIETLYALEGWLLDEEFKRDQLRFGNYRKEFYEVAGALVREFRRKKGLSE